MRKRTYKEPNLIQLNQIRKKIYDFFVHNAYKFNIKKFFLFKIYFQNFFLFKN